jgi:DNA-binding cell septation regulator SpoVG
MPSDAPIRSKIRVISVAPVANAGTIRAFVAVEVGRSLTVKDLKVIQQPGQRPWVAMPSREYVGADGKRRYAPVIEVRDELKAAIESAVLDAWQNGAREEVARA